MSPAMIELRGAKAGFRRMFPPTHPARLAIEAEPDRVSDEEFRHLFPLLVRLAGSRHE